MTAPTKDPAAAAERVFASADPNAYGFWLAHRTEILDAAAAGRIVRATSDDPSDSGGVGAIVTSPDPSGRILYELSPAIIAALVAAGVIS